MKSVQRIHHQTVFSGRVFKVERDRIRLPHGVETTLDIIRHRGSVVLVPQPSAHEVILIRQYRHAIGQWIWELPAGTLEAGEAAEDAARRECAEEIGLSPARVERLGAFYPTPGFCDELMTFYRCAELTAPKTPATPDADEMLEPKAFTLDALNTLLQHGEILDMKTVVGLALLRDGSAHRGSAAR